MTVWLEDTEICWIEGERTIRKEGQTPPKYAEQEQETAGEVWLEDDQLHYTDEDGQTRKLQPRHTTRVEDALRAR